MYKRHRFPAEIIQHAVWLYHRFNLSARDIEDLMAERVITIRTVRLSMYSYKIAEMERQLFASLDDYSGVSGCDPRRIVTDKLGSYGVAHRNVAPDAIHDRGQYANNRAEFSHQPTRVRERGMRRFKSVHQAQRFLNSRAAVKNLFNLGRHLISANHYRYSRRRALVSWRNAAAL